MNGNGSKLAGHHPGGNLFQCCKNYFGGLFKVKRFACPQVIAYILLSSSVVCGVIGFGVFISNGLNLPTKTLICVLIWLLFVALESIIYRHFFFRITIDENGCSNKYLFFAWDDITDFKIVTLKIGIIPKWVNVDILCIGNLDKNKPCQLRPKRTVFFSLDSNTEKLIKFYCDDFFRR